MTVDAAVVVAFQSLVGAMRTSPGLRHGHWRGCTVSIPRRGNEDTAAVVPPSHTAMFQSLVGAMRTGGWALSTLELF